MRAQISIETLLVAGALVMLSFLVFTSLKSTSEMLGDKLQGKAESMLDRFG